MHTFFLGPDCKALVEHRHFLLADGDQLSSVAAVDIEQEKMPETMQRIEM